MKRSPRIVTQLLVIIVIVGGALVSLHAQQREELVMSAEQSAAVQTKLAAIEADRAAFVSQFLWEWDMALGPGYDLQQELGPAAMRAPAWQLYGASLVGDLPTMLRVLGGREGAGKYVATIAAPQAKQAADAGVVADALGSATDSLIYTPIVPCRVVDTRNSGARTGILAAGQSRSFDVTTGSFSKGQGGSLSCPGLPSYSWSAWAVNITATGFSANGFLTVWPSLAARPNASILNFAAGGYAIASGQTVAGCDGCADDIQVYASSPTHIIIDVMGYYSQGPSPVATAVTRIAGTATSMAAGAKQYVIGGACPAGTLLVGGEASHAGYDLAMGETKQYSATTWEFWMINNDTVTRSVTVYSRCIDSPVQVW